ncbi:ATP-dependent Clp protease proteolytic subunit [Agromyces sp. ISL-38]|uniref:ClpP family protease n=1 Tax=Agromyces sp. ISL-38 TaxID=2819107 RepID=UPI001BE9C0FB|nr:ATP-dependent Clp protease proteolytic subunit [Agromyces sp. ISL-38]MBT2499100.1 ATP-dependent Clp protease proteolytic subunit [Agromyces sp. ISL-38]MBT2518357.1 ATP-dependent Clp protease proteolytic subunit [Streptomyces sp. ISL-90]
MSDHDTPPIHPIDAELTKRLFHERIIVLGDELDQAGGNRLVAQLITLAADDPRRDIRFWINSPGGSVSAMLAIADVMRSIPNDVSTIAVGIAASAGQFLLSAGTTGKRFALPHARILMHQGSAGIGGTAVDVELQADDLRYTRDTVLGLVSGFTGQPVERIAEDSLRDRWYTAAEAVDYGFIDHIADGFDELYPHGLRPQTGIQAPTGLRVTA